MLKEGLPGLSFRPKAVCGKLKSTVLVLKISQLYEGPTVIITSQESDRQGTYRLTPCTIKWIWIPWKGNMSVVMMRALPTVSSPQFICVSKTEPWRELKWGRVLVVSLRRLFLHLYQVAGEGRKEVAQGEGYSVCKKFQLSEEMKHRACFSKISTR